MSELGSLLAYLRDPRLTAHATSAMPAWLWSVDASRVLWANPTGAAIFEADSPAALAGYEIDPKGSAALQIARIAGTLPSGAAPRLERLRGFGGRFGRALMCACTRVTLEDRTPAVLVAAVESAGTPMPLAERVRRLGVGIEQPAAFFAADGKLIQATPAGLAQLRGSTSLAAFGAGALAEQALVSSRATGSTSLGPITIDRIGGDASTVLLVTFAQTASQAAQEPAPTAKQAEPLAPAPTIQPAAPAAPVPPLPKPAAERRQQSAMRFVWQMDADGRITIESGEFAELIGAQTVAALARPWREVAAALDLDPEGQVARAIATRDTWSGITISFPIAGTALRLPVELSGLPSFDRERNYLGYRGFGICRNVPSITRAGPAPKTEPRLETKSEAKPEIKPEPKPEPRPEPPAIREERPTLTVVPPVENVLPFRAAPQAEKSPNLTPVERKAFRELASKLTARLREAQNGVTTTDLPELSPIDPADDEPLFEPASPPPRAAEPAPGAAGRAIGSDQRPILDRLPIGVLVYRLDRLLYANRAFLDWTGYDSIHTLADAGGLDALFIEPGSDPIGDAAAKNGTKSLAITTSHGSQMPIEARLFSTPWDGESALVLMLAGTQDDSRAPAESEKALSSAEAEVRELRSILDTATDGIIVLDREGRIISTNRSTEALFGYQSRELSGLPLAGLLAPESQRTAFDALDRMNRIGTGGALDESREVLGRGREGVPIPLVMTMGRIAGSPERLVAVFRDVGSWKKTEQDLIGAKRQAESASSAKSDFLAKISHEIRTPLNAIIGFSEVMIEERFGPVGNDRYKQYLKDIHASGEHLISLLNDLLDLSKIEAGKLDLTFVKLDLNELTQQCVALMQPQANRERIIIRTALSTSLPAVLADARSVRQIALNLLSNSIKFTGAGGQVIVSTALGDTGDVVLRIRDTGVGMSDKDIAIALEPFRQLATSPRAGLSGTGLGLPLTKALAEANRATFSIKSAVNAGTLVEVAFPGTQLAAE